MSVPVVSSSRSRIAIPRLRLSVVADESRDEHIRVRILLSSLEHDDDVRAWNRTAPFDESSVARAIASLRIHDLIVLVGGDAGGVTYRPAHGDHDLRKWPVRAVDPFKRFAHERRIKMRVGVWPVDDDAAASGFPENIQARLCASEVPLIEELVSIFHIKKPRPCEPGSNYGWNAQGRL